MYMFSRLSGILRLRQAHKPALLELDSFAIGVLPFAVCLWVGPKGLIYNKTLTSILNKNIMQINI